MVKNNLKSDLVKEYLSRFSKTQSRTLAVKMYRENAKLFIDVEDARSMIRYYRGNNGSRCRKYLLDKKFIKPNGKAGDHVLKFTPGIKSLDWNVVKIIGTNTILKLADVHIPYHDKNSVELAVNKGLESNPSIILLNGDIVDCFALSRWETDPRERDFAYEIEVTTLFLAYIRETFPKARIIWKMGNHEERYEKYLMLKAPELLNVEIFDFRRVFDLDKYGIELITDKRPIKINKLSVIHGHEYRFAISNPVNPARGLFLRAKANAACDHFHQSSTHSAKNIDDKSITTWSSGCLCELHPRYMPLNEWSHGFSIIEAEGKESFLYLNYKIIDGKIYSA